MNLRNEARGRECQIRSPVCNGDPETVVLAHLNGAGMGRKHDDRLGAWSCSDCHLWVDSGYAAKHTREDRDYYHHTGIVKTLKILIDEGKI